MGAKEARMPDHVIWMTIRTGVIVAVVVVLAAFAIACTTSCEAPSAPAEKSGDQMTEHQFPVQKTDEQWREQLTEEQYHVLREAGTERAFTGKYWDEHADGIYHCAGCGNALFDAEHKFDSGTGWPSYTRPIDEGAVAEREDNSHGMTRTEVVCADCGGHLGHVFTDGPEPTSLRYCINSAALTLKGRQAGAGDAK